jgi:hypothetical protein
VQAVRKSALQGHAGGTEEANTWICTELFDQLASARDGVPQQVWFPLCERRVPTCREGVAGRNNPQRRVVEDGIAGCREGGAFIPREILEDRDLKTEGRVFRAAKSLYARAMQYSATLHEIDAQLHKLVHVRNILACTGESAPLIAAT